MSNRHRRTRIYGANYDIGESYYKKQLNELDSKAGYNRNFNTTGVDSINENKTIPKVSFLCSDSEYNDNASRLIRPSTDINNLEIEDNKIYKNALTEHRHFKDYEDEFLKGPPKPRAADLLLENVRHSKDLTEEKNRSYLKYSFAKEESPLDFEKKAVSSVSVRAKYVYDNVLVKGKAGEEGDASRRVNATKARLHDLEEEISTMTSKQNEREKRKQNLKKILSSSSNNENIE